MLNRREFFGATVGGLTTAIAAYALPGDKFRWACTYGMFSRLAHNLAIATFWGGGTYWDPANPDRVRETVANNISLARDYVAPTGGKYLKVNLTNRGARSANWMAPDQWKQLADTLNEIGRGTMAVGIKFAIHPHAWTFVETPDEVQQLMKLTDPTLVYLIADTAHLTLGGNDPVKFARDWFPRIAGVHLKDTEPKYSVAKAGWKGPAPSQELHKQVHLYKTFETGGVDFVGFIQVLRDRGYDSWISLDFDPLRPGEGEMESVMAARRRYLVQTLKATLRS